MASGFGVSADPLSFADTYVEPQGVSFSPEGSEAQCEDSNGDVVESTIHGEFTPIEATYKVCRGGSFDSTVKLGTVKGSYVITGITPSRNNRDALSVVVSAIPKSVVGDTATLPQYTPAWPAGYMAGGQGAGKGAGATATAGRIISSSIAFTVDNVKVADSRGNIVCVGLFGGRMEGTNELTSCDTEVAATADAGWTLAAGSGSINEVNTDYHSGSVNAFRNITRN